MVHNILEKAADILEKAADILEKADIDARTSEADTSPRHPGSHGA